MSALDCQCESGECLHKSDCAVHNEPALEADCCTCLTPAEKRALPGNHYSDGRRYSYISKAWIFAERWNDREEVARLLQQNDDLRKRLAEVDKDAARWIQWKIGDALPEGRRLVTTVGTNILGRDMPPQVVVAYPWHGRFLSMESEELRVTAYWSAALPSPYTAIQEASCG